jgi:hypothetical protein
LWNNTGLRITHKNPKLTLHLKKDIAAIRFTLNKSEAPRHIQILGVWVVTPYSLINDINVLEELDESMNCFIFWDVRRCSLLKVHRTFGGESRLRLKFVE